MVFDLAGVGQRQRGPLSLILSGRMHLMEVSDEYLEVGSVGKVT